mmetsp:Transcript_43286/g.90657  ORF Transcript_43286/g.90657 Transcript_43286/m.90657 type:complete len:479 (-) Transcript_43286:793-2229(-)
MVLVTFTINVQAHTGVIVAAQLSKLDLRFELIQRVMRHLLNPTERLQPLHNLIDLQFCFRIFQGFLLLSRLKQPCKLVDLLIFLYVRAIKDGDLLANLDQLLRQPPSAGGLHIDRRISVKVVLGSHSSGILLILHASLWYIVLCINSILRGALVSLRLAVGSQHDFLVAVAGRTGPIEEHLLLHQRGSVAEGKDLRNIVVVVLESHDDGKDSGQDENASAQQQCRDRHLAELHPPVQNILQLTRLQHGTRDGDAQRGGEAQHQLSNEHPEVRNLHVVGRAAVVAVAPHGLEQRVVRALQRLQDARERVGARGHRVDVDMPLLHERPHPQVHFAVGIGLGRVSAVGPHFTRLGANVESRGEPLYPQRGQVVAQALAALEDHDRDVFLDRCGHVLHHSCATASNHEDNSVVCLVCGLVLAFATFPMVEELRIWLRNHAGEPRRDARVASVSDLDGVGGSVVKYAHGSRLGVALETVCLSS